MQDFMGNDISVGDTVAIIHSEYRHLTKARVLKLNPKKPVVAYLNPWSHYIKNKYTVKPVDIKAIVKLGGFEMSEDIEMARVAQILEN